MCFGPGDGSSRRRKRPRNNRRIIKPLGGHGYEIDGEVLGRHPITQENITLFKVKDFYGSTIAMLGVANDSLIVTQLYLDKDRRRGAERPLAAEVLLSFWKYFAQLPVRSLRQIFFQTVEEPETMRVRAHAYRVLGEGRTRTVRLRHDSQGIEGEEFDLVLGESKLAKCVRTIAKEFIEMKEGHARIAQFKFVPHGARGEKFHLIVTLEYDH